MNADLPVLVDTTPDLLFGTDNDGRLTWWNPAVERALGLPASKLRQASVLDFVVPDQRERIETAIARVFREGRAGAETRLVTTDGEVHYQFRCIRLDARDGSPRGFVGIGRDITPLKQAIDALERSESRFACMADAALDAVIMIDARGRVSFWNQTAERMFGYRRDEILGRDLHETLAPERYREAYRQGFAKFNETGEGPVIGRIIELEARHRDGHEFPVELSLTRLFQDGEWHALGILRDVSERRRQQQALARANQALRTLSGVNQALVHARDEASLLERVCETIVRSSGYALAWVGFPREDADKTIEVVAHAGDDRGYLDQLRVSWGDNRYARGPAGQAILRAEPSVIRHVDDSPDFSPWQNAALNRGYRSVIGLPLQVPGRSPTGVLTIYSTEIDAFDEEEIELLLQAARDLAYGLQERQIRRDHEKAARQVGYLSLYDPITGLPNRRQFLQSLESAAANAQQRGLTSVVVLLDVDGFRLVNDTLDHRAGDAVLHEISQRLTDRLRDTDVVARLASDEFAILFTLGKHDSSQRAIARRDAMVVIEKVIDCFAEPFRPGHQDTYLTVSIGTAMLPLDADTSQAVLARADEAMHRAKRPGGNTYDFYAPEQENDYSGRLSLGARLHEAVKREAFTLYFQPIVLLDNGRIQGAEALIRWPQADGSLVSPGQFIPVAEELGLIKPIGQWVLDTACNHLGRWLGIRPDLRLCINLSPVQVGDGTAIRALLERIDTSGLPGQALEFEITEGMLIHNLADLAPLIHALQQRGIGLSLDDFGTGYSSMIRLKELPLNTLKIDKSLIGGIPDDPGEMAIVRAVTGMTRGLGMRSLAEGVETAGQWRFLQESGCELGQGFLFSCPVPAERFEALLREDRRWSTSGGD